MPMRLKENRKQRPQVAVALLAIALSGCGGGSGSSAPQNSTVTTTGQYRSLRFTLTTQKYHHRGVPVPLTITVQNVGAEPVAITGFLSPQVEISKGGEPLWNLEAYQRAHFVLPLGDGYFGWLPGVTTTYEDPRFHAWPQVEASGKAVGPGTYTLQASLPILGYNGELLSDEDRKNAPRSLPIEITIL